MASGKFSGELHGVIERLQEVSEVFSLEFNGSLRESQEGFLRRSTVF